MSQMYVFTPDILLFFCLAKELNTYGPPHVKEVTNDCVVSLYHLPGIWTLLEGTDKLSHFHEAAAHISISVHLRTQPGHSGFVITLHHDWSILNSLYPGIMLLEDCLISLECIYQ